MAKVYVGDIGTEIRLDTNPTNLPEIDIATATTLSILVQKPSGAEEEWVAVRFEDTNRIYHYTEDGDLDEAGIYKLQAFVAWADPTSEHRGETVPLKVYDAWT
jgi:hypothetical protein